VHRWRQLARQSRPALPRPGGEFVPVSIAASPAVAPNDIQIQLRRGATTMSITWPVSAAADFAVCMRELLR
jgi:transposase